MLCICRIIPRNIKICTRSAKFNGVLCGRATWSGAVKVYIEQGEEVHGFNIDGTLQHHGNQNNLKEALMMNRKVQLLGFEIVAYRDARSKLLEALTTKMGS